MPRKLAEGGRSRRAAEIAREREWEKGVKRVGKEKRERGADVDAL